MVVGEVGSGGRMWAGRMNSDVTVSISFTYIIVNKYPKWESVRSHRYHVCRYAEEVSFKELCNGAPVLCISK